MIIFLVVSIIAIVIFLYIYTHLNFMKDADGKTLRPMSEWLIFARSATYKNREKMCYSLFIQAANLTEQMNVISIDTLTQIMRSTPNLCRASLLLLIEQHATTMASEEELMSLEKSFKEDHARTYIGFCIMIIMLHHGLGYLKIISANACTPPVRF